MTTTFDLDPSTRELQGPARRVPVQLLVLRLAAALLVAPGVVVPYAAITAALWPLPAAPPARTMESIRTCARKLRSALRCVGAKERLEAMPGIGMRIVALPPQGHSAPPPPPTRLGLTCDPATMTMRHADGEVGLSRQEVAIMVALLVGGGLATSADLLAALHAGREPPATALHVLRVRLADLRRKLRAAGVAVRIAPIRGVGYRLRAEEPPAEVS